MKVRKAIIPAAGLGTRFLPATKAQPKEMLPIVDTPTIQYIIEEAVDAGIEDIIIITGRGKRSIEDHFDRSIELEMELEKTGKNPQLEMVRRIGNLTNLYYVRQKQPLGLGHAVLMAREFVGNEPFAVLLGDDVVVSKQPCIGQMMDVFEERQASVLGVQQVPDSDVSKYGIVDGVSAGDRLYRVRDMVEKPAMNQAPSNVAVLGRYIITPEIFELLATQEAGKGGEIQLTDALKRLAGQQDMYAYEFKGKRYDVGSKIGFLQANIETALRNDELRADMLDYMADLLTDPEGFIAVE
ncbi:MAG: UTP--glucose-1-phosphate uridylyltransferase GalU [Eubacterium sp.]|nr:UTP--glucose-1-phosphate uridylyltransferase GalU [Eubacterium sp.]